MTKRMTSSPILFVGTCDICGRPGAKWRQLRRSGDSVAPEDRQCYGCPNCDPPSDPSPSKVLVFSF